MTERLGRGITNIPQTLALLEHIEGKLRKPYDKKRIDALFSKINSHKHDLKYTEKQLQSTFQSLSECIYNGLFSQDWTNKMFIELEKVRTHDRLTELDRILEQTRQQSTPDRQSKHEPKASLTRKREPTSNLIADVESFRNKVERVDRRLVEVMEDLSGTERPNNTSLFKHVMRLSRMSGFQTTFIEDILGDEKQGKTLNINFDELRRYWLREDTDDIDKESDLDED